MSCAREGELYHSGDGFFHRDKAWIAQGQAIAECECQALDHPMVIERGKAIELDVKVFQNIEGQ